MGAFDVAKSLAISVVVLVGLAALLVALYLAAKLVPKRFVEATRGWIFLLPTLVAVGVGLLIPALRTVFLSFFDDDGAEFVGFANYSEILANPGTRLTVFNSLAWVLVGTVLTVAIGLVMARFTDGMKSEAAAKGAIFLPGAISLVGVGLVWGFVYAGPPFDVGLLNQVTGAIPGLPADWGGSGDRLWLLERGIGGLQPPASVPGANTLLLIVVFLWSQAGLATVVFSAAMKGVPVQLIEAAKIDGATDRQVFWKVVLPLIRSTVVTVATIITITGLKVFDIVAVTTGGNFGTSTVANEFFVKRFVQGRTGIGAALAVFIFLMVAPVMVLNRKAQKYAEELNG